MTDSVNYQKQMTEGLVREILSVIHKYDGSISVAIAIGVVELVKFQLIEDVKEADDD